MVCAYIYNMLVITKHGFADHLKAIEKLLQIFIEEELKVKAEKLFLRCTETEYLGFWVSKYRVRPLWTKVEAMKYIGAPTKVR